MEPIDQPAPVAGAPDYSRKWFVMAAVGMGILLATIDGSIVNIALPTLTEAFGTEFATVQWVVLSYLLTVATLLPIVGRLADMYGRKQLYNWGFVVFTIGSLLCGLAPTIGLLIGARIFQAVGAALVTALGIALVTEAFPAAERGRALGVAGSMVSVGIVTGPTLGGLILQRLSWHWIFFVNLPVGIVGTYLAARFLTAARPPGGQKFDLGGAATLCISVLALLLGLTIGQERGFTSAAAISLFVTAAVFLTAFFLLERSHPQPIVDPVLFRNRLFSVNLATSFCVFIALGINLLTPFYLENVRGYALQQVGLLLVTLPVALGVLAPISGTLSDRFGTRPISVLGLVAVLAGFLAMSTLSTTTSALGIVARFAPLGAGIGLFQSPNNSAIMGTVARDRLGIASGLLSLTRTLGQTVGIAVLGAVWAGMVFRAAGGPVAGGATAASIEAQAIGLQNTARISAGLVGVGLLIALAAWWQERRA